MLAKKNVGLNHVDNNVVIDSHSLKGLLWKNERGYRLKVNHFSSNQ